MSRDQSLPSLLTAVLSALLAGLAGPAPDLHAGSRLDAQLVVYVEVPTGFQEEIVLSIGAIRLSGRAEKFDLEPLRTDLNSRELAGHQIRLVDQAVPSGDDRSLEIRLDGVTALVGRAPVRPDYLAEGLHLPLDFGIAPGRATLVQVQWIPQEFDPDQKEFVPNLAVTHPEVPPPGSLAFVSNEGSNNLSVVDRFTGKVVDVILTGEGPRGIAFSRIDRRLYVADAGSDEIDVIDLPTRRAIRRIALRFGDDPSRVLVSPDEQSIFVLNDGSNSVSVLDSRSMQEAMRIIVGARPRSLALDERSGHLYVASELSDELLAYDPATGAEVASISILTSPNEVHFNSDSRHLYLASSFQRQLLVYDTEEGTVAARFHLCSPATGLAYDRRSQRLYSSLGECGEVAILRPEREQEVGSMRFSSAPGLLSFDLDYRQLLVVLPKKDQVAFVNTNSNRSEALAEVGREPYMVVVPW